MASRERVERKTSPYDEAKVSLTMSTKQLYNSVRNGQKITFFPFDVDEVTGYLAGMDDDAYFVLEPDLGNAEFRKKVIRQSCVSVYQIHEPYTYEDEPLREQMDEIIHKFRTWVLKNVFGYSASRTVRPDSFDQRIAQ